MSTHLVIGDAHTDPDVPNTRFEWLAELIVDRLPDVIVQMGDWCDYKSLSSYDKGKKDFHGRSYERDTRSANEALEIIDRRLEKYNNTLRKNKKELYRPKFVSLGGNHDEGRINKLLQIQPELEGTVNIKDVKFAEYGWQYVPYEEPIEIDGVFYCHHFPTGNSGEPIGGLNLAQMLISKNMVSSTVGHSHILDFAMRATPSGKRICGLSAGCFFDHKMQYAKATQDRFWWSGLVIKKSVKDGDYSPEMISIKELEEIYA